MGLLMVLSRLARGLLMLLTSGSGAWRQVTAAQFFYYGPDYLVFGVILAAAGIFLVYKADAPSPEAGGEPLQDLIKCVEAAVAGDLSGRPSNGVPGEAGRLSHAVGRLIDVLARSENQIYHLAALIENSTEAVISHTLEGAILSWNKGAQRIYGYSAEEVEGKPIMILSPIDQGAEIQRQVETIRNGKRPQPFETLHRARNGRTVKALVRVSPILDSTRQLIGISFSAQELIDIRRQPRPASIQSKPEDALAPEAE